jgi:rhodanese-related sulfurtransferase
MLVILALAVTLAAAPAAVAQVPAVQEAVFGFLTSVPVDFHSIAPAALKARLDAGEAPYLLDVRETTEFAGGYIKGSVNVPIRALPSSLDRLPANKAAEIVVICGSSLRAAYVTMALRVIGYTNVKTMAFGMREWTAQQFPVEK